MSGKLTCEAIARAVLGEATKRTGAELLRHCPRHKDKHESLSVNPKKDVFMCAPCGVTGKAWALAAFLSGVSADDKAGVKAWLKEHGLLNGNGRRKAKEKSGRGPCVATYLYTDEAGTPIARKLRYEPGAEGRKKDFTWQRSGSGKWIDGLGSVKTPLYRWPEMKASDLAVLTEGEKDADAGAKLDLPTTTSGGTGSFRKYHAEALRGKHVVIIADTDEAGRKEAQQRAAVLYSKAASVKVCEIPGSKDLAEATTKGMPREALLALFEETPEWKPATGADLLNSVMRLVRRFICLTDAQARAVALWIAHTHAFDAADCTAYLSVNSAEKQSGKTRLLECARLLVATPWFTGRVTAAVLVRKIDATKPTLLLDESDAAFSGEKEYAEALRGTLNNGYRRGGCASLCVGKGSEITFKDFSVFCAKAIAGIGELPDTVADRSIPIRLKRAQRGTVERFRERDAERETAPLKAKLAVWAQEHLKELREARPDIPQQLTDRQADVCEPLLAIADLAGGNWPQSSRRALVELCARAQADDESIGAKLLSDLRRIFAERKAEEIPSAALCESLAQIETSPWGEWSKGKPLSAVKLARLLKPFDIFPDRIGDRDSRLRGYKLTQFQDAFSRYLPPEGVHTSTSRINSGDDEDFKLSTDHLADTSENELSTNKNAGLGHVDTLKPGTQETSQEMRALFSADGVETDRILFADDGAEWLQ